MRIAYVVSDLTYPAREGLHEQTLLSVAAARQAGHSVDVLGFLKSPPSAELRYLFSRDPIVRAFPTLVVGLLSAFSPEFLLRKAEKGLLQQLRLYDAVHLEGAASAGLARKGIASKTVVSFVDPPSRRQLRLSRDSSGLARLAHRALAFAASMLETTCFRRSTLSHVVSPSDAAYLRKKYPTIEVVSIPVALPIALVPAGATRGENDDRTVKVLVIADLRQRHMVTAVDTFLDDVAPDLTRVERSVQIEILCRTLPNDAMSEKGRALGVLFTDWVSNYEQKLMSADIIVAPDLVGTGLKNRVIQAMACSKPVVGTEVAFEGIEATDGLNCFRYSRPSEATGKIKRLVGDHNLREEMGHAARQFSIDRYNPQRVLAQWIAVYRTLSSAS